MIKITRGGADISDSHIEALLRRVYVDEGFTDADVAERALAAPAVRARGDMLFGFASGGELAGMLILVMNESPGRRIASADEAELQLMAVLPEFRGQGIASRLIDEASELCRGRRIWRLVLWTQPSMRAAQLLYEKHGFVRRPERDASLPALPGRSFLVYERLLER